MVLPHQKHGGREWFSSSVTAQRGGGTVPVMHACGHDAHVTFLIGMAKVMQGLKDDWSGTLILMAQAAEELVEGAAAMVQNGLYQRVPTPDYLISAHVQPTSTSGRIGLRSGKRMAGTDQLDVTFYGVGGHGWAPHVTIDPVVMTPGW
jgi:amidohydrolase